MPRELKVAVSYFSVRVLCVYNRDQAAQYRTPAISA